VLYNAAVIDYNAAVNALNDFIAYRNNQFNPVKPDLVIKRMLEEVGDSLAAANSKLTQVLTSDDALLMSMRQFVELSQFVVSIGFFPAFSHFVVFASGTQTRPR